MESNLIINGIVKESIVDGPGLRFVIFVQGCPHHCKNCHNPGTHPFGIGTHISTEDLFLQYQENPLLAGVTFSGGEPFCQAEPLAKLGDMIRKAGGDVITYTGYLYEDLLNSQEPGIQELLSVTDLLIDGPYVDAQRSLELLYRGSTNQRLIQLGRPLKEALGETPLSAETIRQNMKGHHDHGNHQD